MPELNHPWALLGLPLVALILWWRQRRPKPHLGLPDGQAILAAAASPGWAWLPTACHIAGLTLVVLALADPRIGPQRLTYRGKGVDLMFCLDLSESMSAMDFRIGKRSVSRLEAVANVAERFITSRPGDRVGLVAFGSRAYTVLPPTADHQAVIQALRSLEVGAAGKRTAMGDALVLAVKRLQHAPGRSKAVLIFSDGSSNAGETTPEEAATLAADKHVTVYSVGVGTDEPAPFLVDHPLLGPEIVYEKAPVDASTMRELANATGGIFWRAEDIGGIDRAIARVGAMEPTDIKASITGDRRSLAPILAGLAAVLLTAFALLGGTRYVRLP